MGSFLGSLHNCGCEADSPNFRMQPHLSKDLWARHMSHTPRESTVHEPKILPSGNLLSTREGRPKQKCEYLLLLSGSEGWG